MDAGPNIVCVSYFSKNIKHSLSTKQWMGTWLIQAGLGKDYKGGREEGWAPPSVYRALDTLSPEWFTTPTAIRLWENGYGSLNVLRF